jgi:hypothetical protein
VAIRTSIFAIRRSIFDIPPAVLKITAIVGFIFREPIPLFFSLYTKNHPMLKFLLILGLVLYVVYKIGSLFFRAGAASQFRDRRPYDGVNSNPNPMDKKEKKSGHFKDGEYIDYEEIK